MSFSVRQLITITFLLFISFMLNAQEICNNGIDDDGDTYADCFDSDCPCYMPFVCDEGKLYQSMKLVNDLPGVGVVDDYIIMQMNTDPVSFNPLFNLTANGLTTRINSIGYNSIDNFIYGIDPFSPYTLWRFNSVGGLERLGNVSGLDGINQAGAFDDKGNYYVTGHSEILYLINIATLTATIVDSLGILVSDFAYNPRDGFLYGHRQYPTNMMRLNKIDPNTAAVTPIGVVNSNYQFGACFFDAAGNLIAYGDKSTNNPTIPGSQETLVIIDVNTGVITDIDTSIWVHHNDGCSCPYTVVLDKEGPLTANAGDTITFEFTLTNLSSQNVSGITFNDHLHSGLIFVGNPILTSGIVNISGNTNGQTNAILTIDTLKNDSIATFTIDVFIPCNYQQPAIYRNAAYLTNVTHPLINFPDSIFSDDPNTPAIGDSTKVQISPVTNSTIIDTIGPITICQGDTYVLPNGSVVSLPGIYSDTFSYVCYDSIVDVILYVKPTSNDTLTATICPGDNLDGYTISGTYVDVFTASNGCDSTRTLFLTVSPINCNLEFTCNGDLLLSQSINGQPPTILYGVDVSGLATFTNIQSYSLPLNAVGYNRKDNFIYAYNLSSRKVVRLYSDGTFINLGIPSGVGGYLVAGDVDSAGIYTLTSNNVTRIYRLDLSVPLTLLSSATKFYTNGQSGNPEFADIAFHPQTNVCYGYDINTYRMATINPITGGVSNFGPVYTYDGIGALFFNAVGELYGYTYSSLLKIDISTGVIVVDALGPSSTDRDGCSCPYSVALTKEVFPGSACAGDTVTYQFTIYNSTFDTLTNIDFSDILPPDLTIVTNPNNTFGGSIVNGGIGTNQLYIQGMSFSADSSVFSFDVVLSGLLSAGDTLRNQAVLYNLPSSLGDSVLSDNPLTASFTDSTTLVVNELLASITSVDASCHGSNDGTVEVTVTSGVSPYDYEWNIPGSTQIIQNLGPGSYSVTVTDSVGCFITLLDSVLEPAEIRNTVIQSICQGNTYVFGGLILSQSGIYTDTIATITCDSIVTLDLTVDNFTTTNINQSICQGDTYVFGGLILSQSGVYTDTINTITCDSIVTLDLSVNNYTTTNINQSICLGDTYVFGGLILSQSGVYADTINTITCDSIVTLDLTVDIFTTTNINQSICQGDTYAFGGLILSQTGIYVDTLATITCDSIVTLDLTVNNYTTNNINQSICQGDTYVFGGLILSQTGIYVDTLATITCDSIVTLDLSVVNFITTNLTETICFGDQYIVGNSVYTSSGIYIDSFVAVGNCDSIVTLTLTVNAEVHDTLNEQICFGDSYSGHTVSGNYIDSFTSINGCDSTVNLFLEVFPEIGGSYQYNLCNNDTLILSSSGNSNYSWSNSSTTSSITIFGTNIELYTVVANDNNNCDVIDSFYISLSQSPQVNLGADTVLCIGDSILLDVSADNATYLWSNGSTLPSILVSESGEYSVKLTNGCGVAADSIFIDQEDCTCYLFIPNVFTPNGDLRNDEFYPITNCRYRYYEFMIFDRWGDLVFKSSNPDKRWDGTFNNNECPSNVYVWVLSYTFERETYHQNKKGSVTLIR